MQDSHPVKKRGTRDRPPLSSARQKFFSGVTVKTSRRQTLYIAVYSTVFLCILYLLLIVEVVIKGYCANPANLLNNFLLQIRWEDRRLHLKEGRVIIPRNRRLRFKESITTDPFQF